MAWGQYGQDPFSVQTYDQAAQRANSMGPFKYTPDWNDQELMGLRTRAYSVGQQRNSNTMNEIARAGLLGSSAAFGQINESANQGFRDIENTDAGWSAGRRADSLDLYKGEIGFRRDLEMQRIRGLIEKKLAEMGASAQGDAALGQGIGSLSSAAIQALILRGGA